MWAVAAVSAIANLLFPAFVVFGPAVALRALDGASSWAAIVAASGAGALLGGVLVLRLRARRPLLAGSIALQLFALPLFALAVPATTAVIAVAYFAGSVGLVMFNTLWETTLQRHVPEAALSRVAAYDAFGSLALHPVGFAIWGPVAAVFGIAETLWLAGGLLLAATASMLTVRGIRTLPAAPPAGFSESSEASDSSRPRSRP